MRKVILSKRASQKLDKLLNYLETEWSLKVKHDFISKFDKALSQIKKYPDSSPHSNNVNGLFKKVVTKQTTIYYKFNDNAISVVTIFDNRMNPKKLIKEVK
jgi:plasmid stabilization system protein ParE